MPNNANTFFFTPISSEDIINIIGELKITNSVGVDCISTKIIKVIAVFIAEPLAHIVNLSVELGKFPDELKIGKVIPVYKCNDPQLIDNYRPITVLNVICKIIERAIYNKIYPYFSKCQIISKSQNGFCPGRSTESAATDFLEFVYNRLDNKKYVAALFFDLSKAFDSIEHTFVADKLSAIGIRGNFLSWIISYLRFRKNFVKLEETGSEMYDVDLGVPQGSVLGHSFFFCV